MKFSMHKIKNIARHEEDWEERMTAKIYESNKLENYEKERSVNHPFVSSYDLSYLKDIT